MKKLFSILQKIGKSLMLPVSVLPAAGLLLRFGQPDLLNIPYMAMAGQAIFTNLPMIFAVGVAIGFSDGNGAAALSAVFGELILEGIIKAAGAATAGIDMGVFGGIVIGLLAAFFYNRYSNFKLLIMTAAASLFFAIIGVNLWIALQHWIDAFVQWALTSAAGPAFYAAGKRFLMPLGLHNGYYPAPGVFKASEFPIMMFGLPGAAFGMTMAAREENRTKVAVMMLSAAFAAFVTGIAEPIEFLFIFAAPALFVFHVLAAFASGIIINGLHIKMGYTFSASAIDYVLGYKFAEKPLLIWPVGIAFFLIYFAVFYFSITKFNIKTPGREEEEGAKVQPIRIKGREKAAGVLRAVGGKDNIEALDACITRLRLTLKDAADLDKTTLKALGSAGILQAGNNVQVIFGVEAERIKDDMKAIMAGGGNYDRTDDSEDEDYDGDGYVDAKVEPQKKAYTSMDVLKVRVSCPVDGEVVELSEVPDEVFADKMLGDGFAVKPVSNQIYAPISGVIAVLFPTKHAIVIKTQEGLELLIHIGIDTVKLNGECFTTHVKQGDIVKEGELLITFDKKMIEEKAKSTIIPVIVTNTEVLKGINFDKGNRKHGENTAIFSIS